MTTQKVKVLKPKMVLLKLARPLGNVSQACQIMATAGTPSIGTRISRRTVAKQPLPDFLQEAAAQEPGSWKQWSKPHRGPQWNSRPMNS